MSKQHICYCCVANCSNTSAKSKLAFFSIPNDKRRTEWLRLISREDLNEVTAPLSRRVCEEHFSPNAILYTNTRKKLKRTAMPSRCLPPLKHQSNIDTSLSSDVDSSSSETKDLSSKFTQTENDWIEENKASKVVVASGSKVDVKEDQKKFYDLCDSYLTKDLASLIKANFSLKYKNAMSNKDEYMQFCFNLYKTSPQAYDFFQSVYGLPNCDKILLKEYVKVGTNINDTVMLTLKARVNKLPTKEKNCSVIIGSVKLKANLCYNIKEDKIYGFQEINDIQSTDPTLMALVVMIKGLFSNWKHPIGYVLLPQNKNENMIQNWLENLIKRLFDIGLNVRTLVSTITDDWMNAFFSDTPFFLVNDMKIYNIFDAPDLVKSARDCMILYDIHFQDKVAKYDDIVKFYNADQKKRLPYAHKLTESHIRPTKKEKQVAKYAIEVMSKTVAIGLWNYMQFGLVKNGNIGTVEFITHIHDLFDILNISKQNHEDTEHKRAFCETETPELFKEMLLLFQNLKVINPKNGQDVTPSIKFVKGILITLKAILLLFEDLKTEGHSVLLTSNLQRKALDDFISKLASCIKIKPEQSALYNIKKPAKLPLIKKHPAKLTTLQFTTAFRKLFLSHLKSFTQSGSCKDEVTNFLAQTYQIKEEIVKNDDNNENLLKICKMQSGPLVIKISNPHSAETNENKIDIQDYGMINTSEKHSLMYVCGHLLAKVKDIHKTCHILKHYLYSYVYEPGTEIGRFQRYNQYKRDKTNDLPAAPCDSFISFVENMDAKFVKALTNKHLCQRIADTVYKDIENTKFTPPCPCFPKQYMVKLFIRIKIYYMIHLNNTLFKINRRGRKCLTIPRL